MGRLPMPGAPDDSAKSSPRRRPWVVATTMVATVSTILAATIVNVAFPALIREFNIGHDSLQWIATGFLAATTTSMLATAWLVETFGWRAIFLLSVPFCVAALPLGWRWLSDVRSTGPRQRFDWAGAALLSLALVAVLNFPVVGHRAGWLSAPALVDALLALALATGFV